MKICIISLNLNIFRSVQIFYENFFLYYLKAFFSNVPLKMTSIIEDNFNLFVLQFALFVLFEKGQILRSG